VIGERVNKGTATGNTRVTCHERDVLIELPADVTGDDDRGGSGGSPDGEAVSNPLVEDVATQNEHRTIYRYIVACMDVANSSQMVSESFFAIEGIQISELGIDVEVHQKGHLGVFRSLHEYDSLSVTLWVWLLRSNGCWLYGTICWTCLWGIRCRHRGICCCRRYNWLAGDRCIRPPVKPFLQTVDLLKECLLL